MTITKLVEALAAKSTLGKRLRRTALASPRSPAVSTTAGGWRRSLGAGLSTSTCASTATRSPHRADQGESERTVAGRLAPDA
jgi:hypothetical protein